MYDFKTNCRSVPTGCFWDLSVSLSVTTLEPLINPLHRGHLNVLQNINYENSGFTSFW